MSDYAKEFADLCTWQTELEAELKDVKQKIVGFWEGKTSAMSSDELKELAWNLYAHEEGVA